MKLDNKKIIVFGSLFNPIHKGHENIIAYCLNELEFDYVILLPPLKKYFANKNKIESSVHRCNMLKLLYQNNPKVIISHYELNQKHSNQTLETMQHFQKKYYPAKISLAIGSDNLNNLERWTNTKEIINDFPIYCFIRPNFQLNSRYKKIKIINNWNKINISSSDIHQGEKWKYLNSKVINYIHKHNLYYLSICKNLLSSYRYQHSKNVANTALKIAKNYNCKNINIKIDLNDVYKAAIFHDIAKEWNMKKMQKLMEQHFIKKINMPVATWHQNLSAYFIKEKIFINDKAILTAIMRHTTPEPKMHPLDKILYVADKTCFDRKYKGVKILQNLACKNLNQGFIKTFYQGCLYIKQNKTFNYQVNQKAIDYYFDSKMIHNLKNNE